MLCLVGLSAYLLGRMHERQFLWAQNSVQWRETEHEREPPAQPRKSFKPFQIKPRSDSQNPAKGASRGDNPLAELEGLMGDGQELPSLESLQGLLNKVAPM